MSKLRFLLKLGKTSSNETKVTHPLKNSKTREKTPQRKGSIRKSGLEFEETSKEKIKSTLDKSLGALGPWKQNAGDLNMGCFNPQDQQGSLLNEPINPVMRINGYPINPKGSQSLAQTLDGSLEEEQDLREIMSQLRGAPGVANRFRGHRPGGMGNNWRPLRPINMPASQSMMGGGMTGGGMTGGAIPGGRMLGNIDVNDGYRREKTERSKKKDDIFQNLHNLIQRKILKKRIQRLRARRIKVLKPLKHATRPRVYC